MKRTNFFIVATTLIIMIFVASSAWALSFSSSGYIDASYNDSWDESTLTGTALVEIYIDEDWPVANYLNLEFENDIFNLATMTSTDFTIINPTGWTTSLNWGTNGYIFSASLAGEVATSSNDPIQILINYELNDVNQFDTVSDLINGWAWDEDQAWALSYTVGYGVNTSYIDPYSGILVNNFLSIDSSSGSTSPIPEPGTILLFGFGLLGLCGYGYRRKK